MSREAAVTSLAVGLLGLALWAGPSPAAGQQPAADTASADSAAAPARAGATAPPRRETSGGRSFAGGYAVMAYDPVRDQIGVLAATTTFSAGSGVPHLEQGTGAAVVLGRRAPGVGRAVLRRMRSGLPPEEAVPGAVATADDTAGLQVAALAPRCGAAVHGSADAFPWTGSRRGRIPVAGGAADSLCYLAVGSLLADSTVLEELVRGFRAGGPELLDRFMSAAERAEGALGDVAQSRSAAVWIDAPDPERGALGRAKLRMQVDAVGRPAAALRRVVREGRADHLAHRANRAVERGDHRRAIELADRAVEAEPASALAWLARGRALLYRDSLDRAETAFQRMLEVNPYFLHVLGDPGRAGLEPADDVPAPRAGVIPYRPRLLKRLDVYRRSFFRDVEFPEPDTAAVEGEEGEGGDAREDEGGAGGAPPP